MAPLPGFAQYGTGTKWVDGVVLNEGTTASGHLWIIAFRSKLTWQGINEFFDRQLKALGYMLASRDSGPGNSRMLVTVYVNPECTQYIQLMSDSGVYVLQIDVFDERQSYQGVFAHMRPIP
jgi:hypothetical protein